MNTAISTNVRPVEEVLIRFEHSSNHITWAIVAVYCNGKRMGEMKLIVG
jgi:hypothetical protein